MSAQPGTFPTHTLTVTIDAPYDEVVGDLLDPAAHPEWAKEFFAGPARAGDDPREVLVEVPMMGGATRMRVEGDAARGCIDLFLAPEGAPMGEPLPVRVIRNGSGADVLWTLTRFPGTPDEAWAGGLDSMARELDSLRRRLEASAS